MQKNRLEAFSDGVLAIIITIMVLEMKVPHGTEWTDLLHLWPVFSSYLLSFLFIGIYWVNHHHLFHTVKLVNPGILWANMLLLFWLSLIPFATGWMGENHFEANTVVVYAVLLQLCAVAYYFLQKCIQKSHNLDPKVEEALEKSRIKGIVSQAGYLAAIPIAYYQPMVSCLIFLIVSLAWIVPSRNIEKALSDG